MNRKTIFFVFLSAFLFFGAFAPNGHLSSDTLFSVETALALYDHGSFAIAPTTDLPNPVQTASGRYYSKYGVGYAISFVPLAAASDIAARLTGLERRLIYRGIISFYNSAVAAAFLALLFIILNNLGYSGKTIRLSLILTGSATLLLPYSKLVLVETPTALLLAAFLALLSGKGGYSGRRMAVSGLFMAVLIWLKAANAIYAVAAGGYLAFQVIRRQLPFTRLCWFICPALILIPMLLFLNQIRFGSWTDFGYGADASRFTTPFFQGLYGLTLSPAKSLFLYSPLLLLSLPAFPAFYRRRPDMAVLTALFFTAPVLFYSSWQFWSGGWCWGPRLIVPGILVFHLLLAEFLTRFNPTRLRIILFSILLLFSIGVQLLGASVVYQQIHFFILHPEETNAPHLRVAVRLLSHKLAGKEECYSPSFFGLDCADIRDKEPWKSVMNGCAIDLRARETYQGLAFFWSSLATRTGHWAFLIVPFLLLFFAGGAFMRHWRP